MPKYMIEASYTAEGAKGIAKEGASSRKKFVDQLIRKSGGTMESFYFGFGDADVYITCDMPDVVSAVAISLAVNASGAVHLKTVPLFTVEEMDQAAGREVGYRAPGA